MRMHRGPRLVARERTLAFYLDNFAGGGVQKNTLILAGALAARGHAVELLVCRPRGALHDQLPPEVEVTTLKFTALRLVCPHARVAQRSRALRRRCLGGIALAPQPSPTLGYLRTARGGARNAPPVHGVHRDHAHEPRSAAGPAPCRGRHARRRHRAECVPRPSAARLARPVLQSLVRRAYGRADAIVAVSDGVADDLAAWSGLRAHGSSRSIIR